MTTEERNIDRDLHMLVSKPLKWSTTDWETEG
jgi:hypothetical protein